MWLIIYNNNISCKTILGLLWSLENVFPSQCGAGGGGCEETSRGTPSFLCVKGISLRITDIPAWIPTTEEFYHITVLAVTPSETQPRSPVTTDSFLWPASSQCGTERSGSASRGRRAAAPLSSGEIHQGQSRTQRAGSLLSVRSLRRSDLFWWMRAAVSPLEGSGWLFLRLKRVEENRRLQTAPCNHEVPLDCFCLSSYFAATRR